MKSARVNNTPLKYLTPENLYQQLENFTAGMRVTKGLFELTIDDCTVDDFEWNHMDQLHRPTIHNTYDKGIRIAMGLDFAVSLTQWGRWPFFITVSDVYVSKGLFYQTLTFAGIIVMHNIISLEQIGDKTHLKLEWFIASHKFFKFLHKPISKKYAKLNERLQKEDAQIRNGRFEARKAGYQFRSDPANFYTSNVLTQNTIYPPLAENACVALSEFNSEIKKINIAGLNFLLQMKENTYFIWPAVCPHEGGPLQNGTFCGNKVACPWHGLQFTAVELSAKQLQAARYGFEYSLVDDYIFIKQANVVPLKSCTSIESDAMSSI